MMTRQIRVSGRVQGVGFRYALSREAERHGVRGWVRNRRDGSVEALLQGEADAVRRVVEWARRGPRAARVDALDERDAEPELQTHYDAFEQRPTL
jgi:acylphosphatase